MPFELMDGRSASASSHFYEDIRFPERQVGFWESTAMPDRQVGMDGILSTGSKSVASSLLEKNSALGTQGMELPEAYLAKSLKESLVIGGEATTTTLKSSDDPLKPWSNLSMQPEADSLNSKRLDINGTLYESSLFSCSLSEILSRKLKLSGNVPHPLPVNGLASQYEKEPVESLEEIEAKTIGSLLPDEEDLFSGMTDELGYSTKVNGGDDLEDFDLFSSGGGMELEGNDHLSAMRKHSDFIGGISTGQVIPTGSIVGEHPSRTLFVRNIDSNLEDSELKSIFEQYGDIQTLYTACKHLGFIMISYYDLRASRNAMTALQNKPLGCRKLDIHYSIPKDNAFSHQTSSTLSSPVRMASLDTKFDLRGPNPSLSEIKFQSQYIPSFHPHSLPEYHNNLANIIPYNLRNISDMAGGIGTRVGSNGHSMEINRGAFGSSGNGNCPPHGQHYVWSNSNSYQHHPSSPVVWSSSPSFASGVHAHRLQQMPGFPRPPPYMLNSASPINHHVGSAPAVNPSLWDRGHALSGESPEASNFPLCSLGSSVGFTGGSPLNPMEIASRNIYSRVGGNGLDMTANSGLPPPQQMSHILPGGNPMLPMQALFDYPNERVRSLSYRRNEANHNNADKKQYELDLDRIMCGEDTRTTLMIKNIPNKYTSKMLLAAIDEHCRGYYDFIYLPIDFKNKCNVGYAFINVVDPKKIILFYQAFNGKKWEKFNSEKVAYLAYGRIQGKAALVTHFQNSSLMNEDKRCRPILFHTAGPNAGDQEPFPVGSNIRSRPGKARSSCNEDSHQGSISTFGDGEDSCNGTDSSSGSVKNIE